MLKVINGRRYNTDTAESIYAWSNGHYHSDFRFREKELFRTNKGAWFFWHNGGALSDMAVSVGNNGLGGSTDIEPISDDDAFGFLQRHSDHSDAQAAIEKYFSDRVEDA